MITQQRLESPGEVLIESPGRLGLIWERDVCLFKIVFHHKLSFWFTNWRKQNCFDTKHWSPSSSCSPLSRPAGTCPVTRICGWRHSHCLWWARTTCHDNCGAGTTLLTPAGSRGHSCQEHCHSWAHHSEVFRRSMTGTDHGHGGESGGDERGLQGQDTAEHRCMSEEVDTGHSLLLRTW